MKNWFEEFLNKVRFNKTTKTEPENITLRETVNNIARDKMGRWVSDDLGKPVLKTDDPARIAKFTKRQEDYYLSVAKKVSCCGGGSSGCQCSPKPKPTPKPTVNKKVEEVKAEAKRQQEKYGTTKPVAKKKPTGGGTKKERPIE